MKTNFFAHKKVDNNNFYFELYGKYENNYKVHTSPINYQICSTRPVTVFIHIIITTYKIICQFDRSLKPWCAPIIYVKQVYQDYIDLELYQLAQLIKQ